MAEEKKKTVLAVITERELDEILSIGHQEDVKVLMDALIQAMGEMSKRRHHWWKSIIEKYKLSEVKSKVLTLNHTTGEIYLRQD